MLEINDVDFLFKRTAYIAGGMAGAFCATNVSHYSPYGIEGWRFAFHVVAALSIFLAILLRSFAKVIVLALLCLILLFWRGRVLPSANCCSRKGCVLSSAGHSGVLSFCVFSGGGGFPVVAILSRKPCQKQQVCPTPNIESACCPFWQIHKRYCIFTMGPRSVRGALAVSVHGIA